MSLVEGTDQIMMPFDYDMVQILHKEMMDNGIALYLSSMLTEITNTSIRKSNVRTRQKPWMPMWWLWRLGVIPETSLAREAGLAIGETGGILVNKNYQTSDPDIRLTCRRGCRGKV